MSKSLYSILGSSPELRPLLAHARELQVWQNLFERVVPAQLKTSCRVGQVAGGRVQLLAANGAVAAKLRQLAPALLEEFQRAQCPVREVWVRVEVNSQAAPRRRTGAGLGEGGRQQLRTLAESLENSPLRAALEKLLRHGR